MSDYLQGGKRIPIAEARRVAEKYGYKQCIIICAQEDFHDGGWMATWGETRQLCTEASAFSREFIRRMLGWIAE